MPIISKCVSLSTAFNKVICGEGDNKRGSLEKSGSVTSPSHIKEKCPDDVGACGELALIGAFYEWDL